MFTWKKVELKDLKGLRGGQGLTEVAYILAIGSFLASPTLANLKTVISNRGSSRS